MPPRVCVKTLQGRSSCCVTGVGSASFTRHDKVFGNKTGNDDDRPWRSHASRFLSALLSLCLDVHYTTIEVWITEYPDKSPTMTEIHAPTDAGLLSEVEW